MVRLLFNALMILGCTLLSKFGIIAIINKGYVLLTSLSAPLLFYLLFFAIPWRMLRDKKRNAGPCAAGR
jgi:uncharacterized membrane protein YkvI